MDLKLWETVIRKKPTKISHEPNLFAATIGRGMKHNKIYGILHVRYNQSGNGITIKSGDNVIREYSNIYLYKIKYDHLIILDTSFNALYVDLNDDMREIKYSVTDVIGRLVSFDFIVDEVINLYTVHILYEHSNAFYVGVTNSRNMYRLILVDGPYTALDIHALGKSYMLTFHECSENPVLYTRFLPVINKWFVKYREYFFVINSATADRLISQGPNELTRFINSHDNDDNMVFNYGTRCSSVAFVHDESIVFYEYGNRIYMAETRYPFRIYLKETVNSRIMDILLDDVSYKLSILCESNTRFDFTLF